MPILKGAEIWYPRVHPKRPNARYDKDNPTWEVQIRTYSPAQMKEWQALGLNPKAIVPIEGEDLRPYWKLVLRKKIIKRDGNPSSPVEVVAGNLAPLDPDCIGNGSIANIRIHQYEYDKKPVGKGVASILMKIQIVKLIPYQGRPRDDEFEEETMETVEAPVTEMDDSAETEV